MAGASCASGAGHDRQIRQYDERGPQSARDRRVCDLLITGFGPFPRVARNPSGVLAKALGARPGVASHVFETAYASVARDVPRLAALKPRAVLMLGVAPRAHRVRVELRAINRRATGARDASAALPKTPVIAAGGPAFCAGRHKGMVLVQRLRGAGVAARLSRDAGRYLCNFAYWQMLEALPHSKVVFVHIPLPRSGKKGDSRPAMAQMLGALRAMLRGGL